LQNLDKNHNNLKEKNFFLNEPEKMNIEFDSASIKTVNSNSTNSEFIKTHQIKKEHIIFEKYM